MSFDEILKEMVDGLNGGIGATLMGMDGIAVRQYISGNSGFDVDTVGIEYGKVIEEIKHASDVLSLGSLVEVTVSTAESDLLLRLVTPEYYIAFVIKGGANAGKARYLLKKAAAKADKELAL